MQHLMTKYRAQQANDEKGFTLIELLVVIVILGILAAVVVFSVGGIQNRGDDAACKSTRKTVLVASEAYKAQTGNYATTLSQLDQYVTDLVVVSPTTFTAGNETLTYTPGTSTASSTIGACPVVP